MDEKNTQLLLYLISSFELAAMQSMGKIKNPLTDMLERDLHQAQFSIEVLDMLKEKTRGNLTHDETKFLENVTGQLKLNYLDEAEKDKNTPPGEQRPGKEEEQN
jgi:hypothetical protein